jgi:hypothetical protein
MQLNWDLAYPFLFTVAVFTSMPIYSKLARDKAAEVHAIDKLDYYIDFTQVFAIIVFPLVTFIYARPRQGWAPEVLTLGMLIGAVAPLILYHLGPFAYYKGGLPWTPVNIVAIILNLVGFLILLFGWLQPHVTPPKSPTTVFSPQPAKAIVRVDSAEQVNKGDNLFVVQVHVTGGAQALGGRIIWIANAPFVKNAQFNDGALSFAHDPCLPLDGSPELWRCSSVHLGLQNAGPSSYNVFAILLDPSGVKGVMSGWHDDPKGGYFKAVEGMDSAPAHKVDRTS